MNDTGVSNQEGYCFDPAATDQDLIEFLTKKVSGKELPVDDDQFFDVDLYEQEPNGLTAACKHREGDLAWYFFTPRYRKSKGVNLPRRAVKDGCHWRSYGGETGIMKDGEIVGFKTILDYIHRKDALTEEKTEWRMIEYTLNIKRDRPPKVKGTPSKMHMQLDAWVLCKLFKYPRGQKGNRHQGNQEGPVDQQDFDQQTNSMNQPILTSSTFPKDFIDDFDRDMPMQSNNDTIGIGDSTISIDVSDIPICDMALKVDVDQETECGPELKKRRS